MTSGGGGDLRARMAGLIDKELVERARARLDAERQNARTLKGAAAGETELSAEDRLARDVWKIAAAALRMPEDQLDPQENLANLGIDSIAITEVMVQISRHFGISVAPTTFFEARHVDDLSAILFARHGAAITGHYARADASKTGEPDVPEPAALPDQNEDRRETPAAAQNREDSWIARHMKAAAGSRKPAAKTPARQKPASPAAVSDTAPAAAPIAIISMEGMFPQSPDLDTFEAHLAAGDDCIEEIPGDRWDWRSVHGDPKKGAFTDVKYGGFVPDVDRFDAAFFNISPREAELMDPQHRLFMECVWHLIERAGHAPGSLSGKKIGLFVGINLLDYTSMVNQAGIMEAQQLTGIGHAFCPNRLSFLLDIHGPSEVIDTACSSSLVAIHRAVMSIRHEGCEMAIAGGSNLMLSPTQHIMFSKVGMITPDGRCKTFSGQANGYARADGVGAVLLKRLDLAERDGDPILGVIRGSAEHHGGGATSLTAPNPKAQARLIVEAYRQAGVDPRSIGLIECHGTGTPLGDPIEVEGLRLAFAELFKDRGIEMPEAATIGLGSVKSNIGHAETAAGVAGLIKVILAMRSRTRYRTLHCADPNPLLELEGGPFFLLQDAEPWEQPVVDGVRQPRRAGLSSFGAGGANVHLVIEDYPQGRETASGPLPKPIVVPVSARSRAALNDMVARLREAAGRTRLAEFAYTLQTGRDAMRHRVAFVAADTGELVERMDAFLAGDETRAAVGEVPTGRRERPDPLDPRTVPAETVAARWAAGDDVDWLTLYGDIRPRRVSLPGYAFQRKRFWLPEDAMRTSPKPTSLQPARQGDGCYQVRFTGAEHFLADHRVAGRPTLPGVAYLELARRAAEEEGFVRPVLRQVVWMTPLAVEAPVDVTCDVSRTPEGGARIEISSRPGSGERIVHAQMRVSSGEQSTGRTADLTSLQSAPARHLEAAEIYSAFETMGLAYGPAHRVLTKLSVLSETENGGEVLARIELPDDLLKSQDDFQLHPSLLDGALQAAIGLVPKDDGSGQAALPFSIDTVEVSGPCKAQMWAHVRQRTNGSASQRKMDIDLVADDGSVRVALSGFATRLLARPGNQDILRLKPVWKPLPAAPAVKDGRRKIVLLVSPEIDPQKLSSGLAGWECRRLDDNPDASLAERYAQLARQLMAAAQDLLKDGSGLIQLVFGPQERNLPLGGLVAMLRSISREHPKITGQVLFLSEETPENELAGTLRQAAMAASGALLKLSADGLAVEVWQETGAGPEKVDPPWRPEGVYLITGGTGKLGRLLAADILERQPNATVVLASRNAPGPELAAWIEETPGLHHRFVDLADENAVTAMVAAIRVEHGGLDGVIHAAGVIQDGALAGKMADQLGAVLGPKVTGAVALDKAIDDAPLDFLVLFSSISGIVGNAGQADYAAANAFLDGFAEDREQRRRNGLCRGRTVSIAWPLWREGGMGLDAAQQDLMRRTTGLVPLERRAGLEAFHGALNDTAARVLIAAGNTEKIRDFVAGTFEARVSAPSAEADTARMRPAVNAENLRRRVLACLTEETGAQLKVMPDDLDPDEELTEYGFDSIGFTQFANRLNDRFGLEITPTLFFEYPTLGGLAEHLSSEWSEAMAAALGIAPEPAEERGGELEAPRALETQADERSPVAPAEPRREAASEQRADGAIAIIGMSCRFPGAPDVAAFWEVLRQGRDCIEEIPPDRWDWRDYWGDPLSEPGRGNVKWGGFIEGMAEFDAPFFGISAPEARMMDPQQRLLLTQAWRLMEDAGYAPVSLKGSSTGVFIGTADTGYARLLAGSGNAIEGYAMAGLAPSLGPNRISYYYDFHGPSIAVETACSSALIAIHRAVEAIRSGHCTAAIAGGINALLNPEAFVGFSKAGMLSPGGKCKPFSANADGYARGEGVGLVFLKPLADAERDGDRILAVIRASAENHGGHAASLTAPNPRAQAELLRTAYARAGFDPRTVSYIEAHGTGTPLGDPIEVEALTAAFADLTRQAEADYGPAPDQVCTLGSVKSNIGHLELAAGVAGLIKVLLQMRHGEIAASLHSEVLNPHLKLERSPFRVARHGSAWQRPLDIEGRALPLRAGLSSFGFGGSNAHVVLEEYAATGEDEREPAPVTSPELIVLSARSESQLKESAVLLEAFLSGPGRAAELCDIAHTLQVAREPMEFRLGFMAASKDEIRDRLAAFIQGKAGSPVHTGRVAANRKAISVLETDGPLREAASSLADRGRADDLLALWVGGFSVDWTSIRKGRPGRRIALPGYPFARTAYWVGNATPPAARQQQVRGYELSLDGSESFLRDHLVLGARVLPGVMCFELVRAALSRQGEGSGGFELIGHSWTEPLPVESGPERIEVSLDRGGSGDLQYAVTASGGRRHIARGVARLLKHVAAPQADLEGARKTAGQEVDVEALYRRFADMGLQYGPAQRAVTGLWKGAETVLARLERPAAADRTPKLNPAILDGALQAVLGLEDERFDGLALPYSVRSVQVFAGTEPRMWAVIRPGTGGASIDICDDSGKVAISLRDFAVRPAASGQEPSGSQPVRAADRQARALALVTEIAARTLEVESEVLDVDAELGDFGFDSITMTAFASRINSELGLSLTPADFFEFATLARLGEHIAGDLSDGQLGISGETPGAAAASWNGGSAAILDESPAFPAAYDAVPEQGARGGGDPVVIVGQSGAFPMARDTDEFWSNLIAGRDCISRIPEDRWDWRVVDGDPKFQPGKTDIHWGGFTDGVFEFDPLFFNISPREAKLMDPQQRLMLIHAWKAIEDAGHSPKSLAGRKVGVFVGTSSSGYSDAVEDDAGGEGYVATGSVPSVGPNRISYFLDLRGPSEPVETACSSSLVALHRAVQAIEAGDCDMALVGGVNTIVTPDAHINFAKAGMLSPDGRCKTFSAAANGYVRGEGVGMLFLRRRSDAQRDSDPILATVLATAINHGGHANSLTAPNTQAQAELLKAAYAKAAIDPRTVGYIEAHGTGTALGDPVEINALKSAFSAFCGTGGELTGEGIALGSVKTNIGHLELAAGVAGVIKVLKQFEHRRLAPSLHCSEINPFIDLEGTPFRIVREASAWTPVADGKGAALPLRAGVSSFGFGGVNAHAVLEEYRPEPPASAESTVGPFLFVMSARDKERLAEVVTNLLGFLEADRARDLDPADLAHTLQVGRAALRERLAIVAGSVEELAGGLKTYLSEGTASGLWTTANATRSEGTLSRSAGLPEIARHWVDGGSVDWRSFASRPHRRLRLPTYPFARDIHNSRRTDAGGERPADVSGDPDLSVRLDAGDFYLRDHRINGRSILPGAMSLEFARKAVNAKTGSQGKPLAFSNISWRRPVELETGQADLLLPLRRIGEEAWSVSMVQAGPTGNEYMRAEVRTTDLPEPPPHLALDDLARASDREHDPDWLYACYASLGIDYGPAFRAVTGLKSGKDTVLARLRLPEAARRAGGTYGLHPVIIDAAFHSALALFADDGEEVLALPYGIDRMSVFGSTTETMWAHLQARKAAGGIRKLDIDLADEIGRVLVRIEGFTLRLLKQTGPKPDAPAETLPKGTPSLREATERYFAALVARETQIDAAAITHSAPLEDYGIDSILITRLTDELERDFGPLSKTLFFEHQTLGALVDHFLNAHAARLAGLLGAAENEPRAAVPSRAAIVQKAQKPGTDEPVAIIGVAGRYPGARTLDEFWQNLAGGRDSITEIPADRWDHSLYFDPERKAGKTTSKWGGFIEGHDRFDPMFFNIAPRDAQFMDPQERLFLQCAWEVLEDSGYTRATVAPGRDGLPGGDVGVFAGVMWEEYQLYGAERSALGQPLAIPGSPASIANRVSYFLNFHGPSIAVDSMCSSSLTAIHLACESLRSGDCSVALAGGVNLTPHPNKYLALSQSRFLSSKGRCESFGEGGDGYVPAEGVGAVLLKPLSRAEADGDRIHGVILGSALNHGGKTNGYTVPNPGAQAAVIEKALRRSGVSAGDISYVEAHGTGTSLGDPIEIASLAKVLGNGRDGGQTVAIGSVKSNIGHAESAAGIAGLTKILLQLKHGRLAPSLHSQHLNPNIDFAATPFRVQQRLDDWHREEGARIAGLSSFGAGGSNAHFVVAEYVDEIQERRAPAPEIYPFSARDATRLEALVARFRTSLDNLEETQLPSAGYVLQEGREAFEERLAIVAEGKVDLAARLDRVLAGETDVAGVFRGNSARKRAAPDHTLPLESLAGEWVRGARIDWSELRPGPKPRPVGLPTYPFAEDYCWLPEIEMPAEHVARPQAPLPMLFAPLWQEQPDPGSEPAAASLRTIVLCGDLAKDRELADALRDTGAEVVQLDGPSGPVDKRYEFHASKLLDLLKKPGVQRAQNRVLQVVVAGDGVLEGLGGMLRCAALEQSKLSCQLIAVEGTREALAGNLTADAAHARDREMIRYRDGHRHVRRWRELAPAVPAGWSPWKENGVYLLTGGAGGIGLSVARHIAETGNRPRLWLTGRSAMTPEVTDRLADVEALGARVRYRQVDVTDPTAVTALLEEIERTDGRLTGVIHGAGLTRDGLLLNKDDATLREVLAPKVTGLRVLDDALGDRPLDFLVLFASAAGALGNPGQSDYAAANAFLDRYALERNTRVGAGTCHGRTVAIDWPYWREGGMKMDARTIDAMEREAGVRPLETGSGLAALEAVLAGNEEQVLVLEGDRDRLRRMLQPVRPDPLLRPAPAARRVDEVRRSEPEALPADRDELVALIRSCFSRCLGIPQDKLGMDDTIDRFGVDSVSALEIVEALEEIFGPLPQTILFEVPTIGQLADELIARGVAPASNGPRSAAGGEEPASVRPSATSGGERRNPEIDGIAIIAVAGRYPGAETIEAFSALLREGRDAITEIPPDRAHLLPRFSERKGEPDSSYCKWGGFLADVDRFDAAFFGYTPRVADLADPQERVFLETSWHLLERAGITRKRLAEQYDKRVGVFVGSMYQQYSGVSDDVETRKLLALSSYSGIANRVSFFLDLQGPSVAVDSMCSSGLQAVHQACQSLKSGECRLAIAGGVNLTIHPAKFEALSRAGLVGSHPGSRAFSGGDGYLPAEAVGAVLLKPLAQALADGDTILGVVRGSLANHAGHSAGYGVPNAEAQVRLLEDAFSSAGIDPATIGFVEAAATGSQIGDAVELRALGQVYSGRAGDGGPIAIGSVKTQIGHAEAASGLAQLTKVLLQFEARMLFPSMGFETSDLLKNAPFRPQTSLMPWSPPIVGGEPGPRRAAISSFGAGGSNVHLILEEPPAVPAIAEEESRPRLFPVSARTPGQLAELRRWLADFLRRPEPVSMAAVSRTLRHGRERFDCRIEFVATAREELAAKLDDPAYREDPRNLASAADQDDRSGPMLVLPGYPFARERHWLPQGPGTGPAAEFPKAETSPMPRAEENAEVAVSPDRNALRQITRTLAAELGCRTEDVDVDAPLTDLGLDSMGRMRLGYAIEECFGVALEPEAFETPQTARSLVENLLSGSAGAGSKAGHIRQTPARDGSFQMPLGDSQKGLWVLQSLFPQSSDYNVPLAFKCRNMDSRALKEAAEWLASAYPILAARVIENDGDPWLVASGEGILFQSSPLPKEIEAAEFVSQRARTPFDLTGGVFRVEHFTGGQLEQDESILLLVAHHIVTDGVSSAVMTRKFWEAYGHFAGSGPLPSGESGTDYAEFAAWETEHVRSADGQAQKRYWLERLRHYRPDLALPMEAGSEQEGSASGQTAEQRLPEALSNRVRETARAKGISPAAFYLGIFSTLLYRYSGTRDFVIGVPTARRPARRFAQTLGYCANMIALRIGVDPAQTFAALTAEIGLELSEGLKRSDFPFAAIAREWGGADIGTAPYQVTFAYQNFVLDAGNLEIFSGGQVALMPQIRQLGGEDLGMEVQHEPGGALVILNYDGNRFSRDRIERMFGHFRQLLEAALDDDEVPVSSLPLLTKAETNRALYHWSISGRGSPAGVPVHDQVLAIARNRPSATAITDGDRTASYRELFARSKRIARSLEKACVQKGDRVAVLLNREAGAIAAMLAVMSVGAVWVPVDPDFPDERIAAILKDSGSVALLTRGAFADRLRGLSGHTAKIIDLDRLKTGLPGRFARYPRAAVHADDPAYIIYTSGSTGTPKGVMVSHGALSGHCGVIAREYGLGAEDVVLQFASMAVDTAIEQILPVLVQGGRLVLRPQELLQAADFLAFLKEKTITVADLPPAYLHDVLRSWDRGNADLSGLGLRLMIAGGEILAPEVVEAWSRCGLSRIRLVNAYGPTEATVTALVHTVKPGMKERNIPIGRPLPGTEVYILDREGNLVPDGVVGELHLGGDRLAIGYHGCEDVTAAKFRDHAVGPKVIRLYATGDLACFRPNSGGVIEFRGRIDDQVKIRGHRVELGEIEAAILACGVAEAAVVIDRNRDGETFLTAHVGDPWDTCDEEQLRRHIAASLPAHMMPSRWTRSDVLPKTPGGKIDRRALSSRPAAFGGAKGEVRGPRDRLEKDLLAIWHEVLGSEPGEESLGIDDDFADAGGHSLLTLRLQSRIEQAFGVGLSARDLIRSNTIAAQARLLRSRGVEAGQIDSAGKRAQTVAADLLVSLAQPDPGTKSAPPVFLFHPIGGTLGCYQKLVERLTANRPVMGIRARGLEPGEDMSAQSLEGLAADYCRQIQTVQPDGPYTLWGWSLGGVIAFEIARILHADGHEIASLGLIDSYTPAELDAMEGEAGASEAEAEHHCRTAFLRDLFGIDVALSPDEDVIGKAMSLPQVASVLPGIGAEGMKRLFDVFRANFHAFRGYRPESSEVPAILVRATEGRAGAQAEHWSELAVGPFRVCHVAADHYSVLREPALSEWVSLLCEPAPSAAGT